jgi:hypothetical protein
MNRCRTGRMSGFGVCSRRCVFVLRPGLPAHALPNSPDTVVNWSIVTEVVEPSVPAGRFGLVLL